jgi:hypothetical protein
MGNMEPNLIQIEMRVYFYTLEIIANYSFIQEDSVD